MRTKKRQMNAMAYDALCKKIMDEVQPVAHHGIQGTSVFFATGDGEPTQNMADVRFILTDNPYDCHLFVVDGVGDAILIEKE